MIFTAKAGAAPGSVFTWLRQLGPGLVSGAADDDPSGIATYSQAGAQLGYGACWILLLCYPIMVVTQEISGRIGCASGQGIIAMLRRHYPARIAWAVIVLVVFANIMNLGADLAAMADVLCLLFGKGSRLLYVVLCGGLCAGLLLRLRLKRYVQVVKWSALSLFTYVVAALDRPHPWTSLLYHTIVPTLAFDAPSVAIFVAVMGTTISPYLFIWQSSLEGERTAALSRLHPTRPPLAYQETRRIRTDTCAGMALASLVAYAVVLTTASTLHTSGITLIQTSAQAAEALRPAAGSQAQLMFSLGILATGFLAIPMLAGSSAYAIGEGVGWPVGLARAPSEAPAFYGCIAAATAIGVVMNLADLNPIRALLWSALVNGVLSVPVLIGMMLIGARREIMGQLTLSRPLLILGWSATAVMGATVITLVATIVQ